MDGKNVRRLVPFEELPDEVGSRELDDDLLASYQKQFNYSAELDSVYPRVGENGGGSRRLNGRRLTPLPCSPASRVLFTTTSANSSRGSLTRLSTRCVKRTS